jgi:hypothetical protein
VLLAEDACAALSRQAHDNAVNAMDPVFARARTSQEIIRQIRAAAAGVADG